MIEFTIRIRELPNEDGEGFRLENKVLGELKGGSIIEFLLYGALKEVYKKAPSSIINSFGIKGDLGESKEVDVSNPSKEILDKMKKNFGRNPETDEGGDAGS